jgi:hypothetical protein
LAFLKELQDTIDTIKAPSGLGYFKVVFINYILPLAINTSFKVVQVLSSVQRRRFPSLWP